MQVSLDWMKEFVALENIAPAELMKKVTLSICEVESVSETGAHLDRIFVAQIISIKKHPEADKLNLVTFDYGGKTHEVVCGAPNVRVGLKIPYATLGTKLPNGMFLEPKAIRGVMSEGMLCSKDELGMGGDHSGLWELPEEAVVGQTLAQFLKEKKDIILDIDNKSLTHRPDLWGIYGMAREVASLFARPLQNPFNHEWIKKIESHFTNVAAPIVPRCDGESACLAYFALTIEGVQIKESAPWIQRRLLSAGLRPINNMVDISNYVMLELGIPNHLFDADLINKEIILKRLPSGTKEKFQTLDGVERELIESDTVVADANGPLVIAGVMGGLKSGVTEKTSRLLVEVANWKAGEIRKTSARLGLRTDSSQRYEKALDSQLLYRTLLRLVELILADCPQAKVIGHPAYAGEKLDQYSPLQIKLSADFIRRRLGKDVSDEEIKRIFSALDFKVASADGHELMITVPSYRSTKDIENREDLVEEIGRMVGYDNIAPVSPMGGIATVRLPHARQMLRKIQDYMVMNAGALEVFSYPMVGGEILKRARWPELNDNEVVKLANALSLEHDRMRPSMIPGLLESVALNQKYHDSFRFFEVGRIYSPEGVEETQVVFATFAKKETHHGATFMEVANKMEGLLKWTKIPGEICLDHPRFKNKTLPRDWKGSHPFEFKHIQVMGKVVGGITTVHPLLLREFKIKGTVVLAVMDIGSFHDREMKDKTSYKPLPKFPTSTFDCTVLVGERTPVAEVLAALKKVKMKELRESKVVVVFPMPEEGKKAVTLRSFLADDEKTLSSEVIKMAEEKIMASLASAGFPLKS